MLQTTYRFAMAVILLACGMTPAFAQSHRFTPAAARAVDTAYSNLPDCGCMNALYYGSRGMYGWTEAERVEFRRRVFRHAEKTGKVNGVHRIMEILHADGQADRPITIDHIGGKNSNAVASSLEAAVLAKAQAEGGIHFFVLAVNGGYHTVLLGVGENSRTGNWDIYWFDQFAKGFDANSRVTGKLDQRVTSDRFKSARYGWSDIQFTHLRSK